MNNCVTCQAELSPSAKFCGECGSPRALETRCRACSAELEPGVKYCSNCGSAASALPAESPTVADRPPAGAPLADAGWAAPTGTPGPVYAGVAGDQARRARGRLEAAVGRSVPVRLWLVAGLLTATGLLALWPVGLGVDSGLRLIFQGGDSLFTYLGVFTLVIAAEIALLGAACIGLAVLLVHADRVGRALTIAFTLSIAGMILFSSDHGIAWIVLLLACAASAGIVAFDPVVKAHFSTTSDETGMVVAARALLVFLGACLVLVGTSYLPLIDFEGKFGVIGVVMIGLGVLCYWLNKRLALADNNARIATTVVMAIFGVLSLIAGRRDAAVLIPVGLAASVITMLWAPLSTREFFGWGGKTTAQPTDLTFGAVRYLREDIRAFREGSRPPAPESTLAGPATPPEPDPDAPAGSTRPPQAEPGPGAAVETWGPEDVTSNDAHAVITAGPSLPTNFAPRYATPPPVVVRTPAAAPYPGIPPSPGPAIGGPEAPIGIGWRVVLLLSALALAGDLLLLPVVGHSATPLWKASTLQAARDAWSGGAGHSLQFAMVATLSLVLALAGLVLSSVAMASPNSGCVAPAAAATALGAAAAGVGPFVIAGWQTTTAHLLLGWATWTAVACGAAAALTPLLATITTHRSADRVRPAQLGFGAVSVAVMCSILALALVGRTTNPPFSGQDAVAVGTPVTPLAPSSVTGSSGQSAQGSSGTPASNSGNTGAAKGNSGNSGAQPVGSSGSAAPAPGQQAAGSSGTPTQGSGPQTMGPYTVMPSMLNVRTGPSTDDAVVGTLHSGDKVSIQCTSQGPQETYAGITTTLWDRIVTPAGYVSDAYIDTGGTAPQAATCS